MKVLQQGDVLIKEVKSIPAEMKKMTHLVLAEGEHTGHSHQVVSGLACLYGAGNDMFLKVLSDTARLKHEEHGDIELKKGDYEIGRVNEYDHFDEEARRVQD